MDTAYNYDNRMVVSYMARMYQVSADMSEKEKVIGGYFTAMQGVWLGLGVAIILGLTLLLQNFLPLPFAVGFSVIPGCAVGIPFAFKKKMEMPLATYLFMKKKFDKKTKHLINSLHSEPKDNLL